MIGLARCSTVVASSVERWSRGSEVTALMTVVKEEGYSWRGLDGYACPLRSSSAEVTSLASDGWYWTRPATNVMRWSSTVVLHLWRRAHQCVLVFID